MAENTTPEIVKQGYSMSGEQKPLIPVAGENQQAAEDAPAWAEMSYYELEAALQEGKLPIEAIPLYFQKLRDDEIRIVQGLPPDRPPLPENQYFNDRKIAEINAAVQERWEKSHSRPLHTPEQQRFTERKVAMIDAKYNGLINGSRQEQARYFANQASDISLNHKWTKQEDISHADTIASNLYGMASQLTKPREAGQPAEAQINAVRTALHIEGKPAA